MKLLLLLFSLLLATLSTQAASCYRAPQPTSINHFAEYFPHLASSIPHPILLNTQHSALASIGFPPFLYGLLLSVPGVFLVWYLTDAHVPTRQAIWGASAGVVVVGAVVFFILNRTNAE